MDSFGIFNVSASALEAQRTRMNVIASNIANVHSTKTPEGGPYVRKDVVFSTMLLQPNQDKGFEGVKVTDIIDDTALPIIIHDPGHPDADNEGNVAMPNINIIKEMVDMMTAQRAYEANIKAFNSSKAMFQKALELGR
jgi:flagellar basal-body rod protein FlgC